MNPTRIRLGGPSDILAVLPYQLGFHPRESLVVVSLHGTRMGLVQRIDLPPPEHTAAAVEAMLPPLRRDAPDGVLLLGFERSEGDCLPLVAAMAHACHEAGVGVRDRLVIRDGRWFSLHCADAGLLSGWGAAPAAAARGACRRRVRRPRDQPSGGPGGARGPPASGRPPASDAVAACADEWLSTRRAAYEDTAAAFHDLRRRELQTWATVLRCRDEDGPLPPLSPPSWPGWRCP